MEKCVTEIIHICEVCIKREVKRKETEGRIKAEPAKLEGTEARDHGSDSIPSINTSMYNAQEESMVVVPGKKDTGSVPLAEQQTYTSERGNMCNEHHLQLVGSPFPKSVLATPQPTGAALLNQSFRSMKFNHSARILPYKPEFPPQVPDLCSPLETTFGPVQKMNTAPQCFWVPETDAYFVW